MVNECIVAYMGKVAIFKTADHLLMILQHQPFFIIVKSLNQE